MLAQSNDEAGQSNAARDLMLADFSTVQQQNVTWLSRRFGFEYQLASLRSSRGGETLGLEESALARMPTWPRRITVLRRALLSRDDEARKRLMLSIGLRFLPHVRRRLLAPQPLPAIDSERVDPQSYAAWIGRYDTLTDADRTLIAAGVAAGLPGLLVVVRLDQAAPGQAGAVVAALRAQLLEDWRALLVLDDAIGPDGERALAGADPRIAIATSEQAANHPYAAGHVVLAEPTALLRPDALYVFADAVARTPSLRLVYADEDRVRVDGERHAPAFKPCFSPELNRRLEYLGDCVCVERSALPAFLAGSETVSAWASRHADAMRSSDVRHVPRILFGTEGAGAASPRHRPRAADPGDDAPTVAIIIPTRNQAALLSACVHSLRTVTRYDPKRMQIVLVDNGSDDPEALTLLNRLAQEGAATVLRDPRPFNYSRLNNFAASSVTADVLVLLNNDTEAIEPDWLRTLVGLASQPDVGVVGLKLLYPDRTVQHGGVVLGIGGVAGHSFVGIDADAEGYLGLAGVTREVAAVTGACMAVRRSVYEEIGGLDERLEIAFNDTALCCEALRRGYRNLYAGDTSMLHHESKSRGLDDTPDKLARFRQECVLVRGRYKDLFDDDPYYSPNLGLERQFQPAIPRTPRPWRRHRRTIDPQPRILILSAVHATGHGVPVVIQQHADYLAGQGCTVFVGGPMAANEINYRQCQRVYLDNPAEAQSFAFEADVDCVIAHTMPFFSMFRTMGSFPRRVIFDHGEPPPALFPDRRDRENIDAEKQFCYRFTELVLTNTATVKDEIAYPEAEVAGLGNSHLATWDPARALRRDAVRARLGLSERFVVLNVCRFHRAERTYKGIDDYVALKRRLEADRPDLARRISFVLCGKGNETDVAEMEAEGLTVFANLSDAELAETYGAADLYANFSRWEGFNLGIAQALAMGLHVIASDIPAHRQFPISTAASTEERARLLAEAADAPARERVPVTMEWEPLLRWLHRRLVDLCRTE